MFVMTPPNEHAREGGRDDRGVPYHAESTLSSAQVLKYKQVSETRVDLSNDMTWRQMIGVGVRRVVLARESLINSRGQNTPRGGRSSFFYSERKNCRGDWSALARTWG